ncbi:hypothetical protein KHC28_25475 [Ancylobacter sonchi]|uniref:hypothetical protein n=1 Tax=Ancylobacter sonchi TaxID=1937790 RepID=UPI001BD301E4|nr:hypothetical protein [Ancylobacter sonchi]MBS7537002.1 hypothetical protein [Ancylobacter sonchi]
MRTLVGALALAKMQGREFSYHWAIDHRFGAELSDLWEFPYRSLDDDLARDILKSGVALHNEQLADLEAVDGEAALFIKTIHEMRHPVLRESGRMELRRLDPVAEVRRRVLETWDKGLGAAPYVAVMIRAHAASHATTLRTSPLEWYVERMQELADRFSGLRFFLSTDSPEAQEAMLRRFGRVVVQDDKGGYNSKTGLQAAVADLYLLAAGSFVLQPYWSSFPAMSRALADPRVRFVDANSAAAEPPSIDLPLPADPLRPYARA